MSPLEISFLCIFTYLYSFPKPENKVGCFGSKYISFKYASFSAVSMSVSRKSTCFPTRFSFSFSSTFLRHCLSVLEDLVHRGEVLGEFCLLLSFPLRYLKTWGLLWVQVSSLQSCLVSILLLVSPLAHSHLWFDLQILSIVTVCIFPVELVLVSSFYKSQ